MWSRGSEWRLWDLHVHVPGTCRANEYGEPTPAAIDRFCEIIEESNVQAIGITDYFRLQTCFRVIDRFRELYVNSEKLLVPNLELRVGADGANPKAEAHILFDPSLGWEAIRGMLARIPARHSSRERGSISGYLGDFAHGSVPEGLHVIDLESVVTSIGKRYGERILVVAVCGADGMSFATDSALGQAKAAALRDHAHAGFGTPTDADRHAQERSNGSPWRGPIFSGSDCHSFEDLGARLGKSIQGTTRDANLTWIKANASWDGLRQTIADPDSRVHIGPTKPESRLAGSVIASLTFPGRGVYPDHEMPLNAGLVAVVGSRSSGKSSLLAQVARAASPSQTAARLKVAGKNDGPCAGQPWDDAAGCSITWGDGREGSRGSLIYIPQDYIHESASDVAAVTRRIQRILEKDRPDLHLEWQQIVNAREAANDEVIQLVGDVAEGLSQLTVLKERLAEGERSEALALELANVEAERMALETQFALSTEEATTLAGYREARAAATDEGDRVRRAQLALGRASTSAIASLAENVSAHVELSGLRLDLVPGPLAEDIRNVIEQHSNQIGYEVGRLIDEQVAVWASAVSRAEAAASTAEATAAKVLAKIAASEEQNEQVEHRLRRLRSAVEARAAAEKKLTTLQAKVEALFTELRVQIDSRSEQLASFAGRLTESGLRKGTIRIFAEVGFSNSQRGALAERLDGRSRAANPYLRDDGSFAIEHAQANPADFIRDVQLGSNGARLKRGEEPIAFAATALGTGPDLHLVGELDGDRIGGFSPTSMSPGKSAQFAFELIVASARDDCPLLLDQPEDDLDSESIVASVLPRLRELRKTRQIILVTHNANLVVGADADQVVVADRRATAEGDYVLKYRAGPLEDEPTSDGVPLIRDSVCTLLDGGVPAMERRLARYRIGVAKD